MELDHIWEYGRDPALWRSGWDGREHQGGASQYCLVGMKTNTQRREQRPDREKGRWRMLRNMKNTVKQNDTTKHIHVYSDNSGTSHEIKRCGTLFHTHETEVYRETMRERERGKGDKTGIRMMLRKTKVRDQTRTVH